MSARKANRRVLWLDDLPAQVEPYVESLRRRRIDVTLVDTLTQARERLEAYLHGTQHYDLVILDVMVPTKTDAEEEEFPPEETDQGFKAGLILYRHFKSQLSRKPIQVLLLSSRLDADIEREIQQEGLPLESFATKFELRNVVDYQEKIRSLLAFSAKRRSRSPHNSVAR